MILELQLIESSWKPASFQSNASAPPAHNDTINGSDDQATDSEGHDYFMAKVSCLTSKVCCITITFFLAYMFCDVLRSSLVIIAIEFAF